jgi:hypothetical protein
MRSTNRKKFPAVFSGFKALWSFYLSLTSQVFISVEQGTHQTMIRRHQLNSKQRTFAQTISTIYTSLIQGLHTACEIITVCPDPHLNKANQNTVILVEAVILVYISSYYPSPILPHAPSGNPPGKLSYATDFRWHASLIASISWNVMMQGVDA